MSFNEAFHYCAFNRADIFFGGHGYVTLEQSLSYTDSEGVVHGLLLRTRGQDVDPALALVMAVVAMIKKTEAYRLRQVTWEQLVEGEAAEEPYVRS